MKRAHCWYCNASILVGECMAKLRVRRYTVVFHLHNTLEKPCLEKALAMKEAELGF